MDYEKLSNEFYSVIAHASAGSDFDDITLAVNGCIEEVKKFVATNPFCQNCREDNCEWRLRRTVRISTNLSYCKSERMNHESRFHQKKNGSVSFVKAGAQPATITSCQNKGSR